MLLMTTKGSYTIFQLLAQNSRQRNNNILSIYLRVLFIYDAWLYLRLKSFPFFVSCRCWACTVFYYMCDICMRLCAVCVCDWSPSMYRNWLKDTLAYEEKKNPVDFPCRLSGDRKSCECLLASIGDFLAPSIDKIVRMNNQTISG